VAEVRVTLYAVALLLMAGALLLWQWAARRASRRVTGRNLAHQLAATVPRTEPAFDIRAATTATLSGITVDPWRNVGADAPVAKSRLALPAVPGWLEGVVTMGQLVTGTVLVLGISFAVGLGAGPVAAGVIFLLLLALGAFGIWHRAQKMRALLVAQLPAFIDAMVRLITIGNAIHAAFQLAIPTTKAPLREYMEKANALVRAGVDLDQALAQMAERVRIEEMHLLASILGLGVRYGGRADLLLERVAHFMRDREQAQHELVAMSAETRLSAWILGLMPLGVGAAIVLINPAYFALMWQDDSGRSLLFGAFALQVTGVILLYRLARLS
jgi:tight adherence protein B